MKTAIAVFCKTPGLSSVKTRLAADIGNDYAEEFYRLCVLAIDEVLGEVVRRLDKNVEIYWAVAEREALTHSIWDAHSKIWTGEGGLGERIYYVYEQLFKRNDQVIIIGSDSPQITADYLVTAIETLRQPEWDGVIGPCRDGGFVLFGSKQLIQKSIWTSVIYSRKDTLHQLTTLLEDSNYSYQFISGLGDVDQYDDLILLLNDFLQIESKIQPGQIYLYHWIQKILTSKRLLQKV